MSKKIKKISVIIPCFNSRQTIARTIESILKQNLPVFEIIVIDDKSTDDSFPFIKNTYKKTVRLFKNSKNYGAAHTRNVGIQKAQGELLLFIDSDVVMKKNTLTLMYKKILPYDIVFPKMVYANSRLMYPNTTSDQSYLLISPCFMIKKGALRKLDNAYFDEHYRIYCEDTDFFLRCYLQNLSCFYVKNATIIHETNKPRFREDRYFWELKNSFYGLVKFWGFKLGTFDHAFRIRNILQLVACGICNFNLFDAQTGGYDKSKSFWYKIKKLLRHKEKLTNRGIWYRLQLTKSAFVNGIEALPQAFRMRQQLLTAHKNRTRV